MAAALGRLADAGLIAVAPRPGGILVTVRPPLTAAESPKPAPPPAPDWWHNLYRESILAVQWVVAQEPANEWLAAEFPRQAAVVIHAVESGADIDTLPEKWVWQIVQRANTVHKQHGHAAPCGGLVLAILPTEQDKRGVAARRAVYVRAGVMEKDCHRLRCEPSLPNNGRYDVDGADGCPSSGCGGQTGRGSR